MFSFFFSLLVVAGIGIYSSNHAPLTEQQARSVLYLAGWPEGVHKQALSVMSCESSLITDRIGDSGDSLGLFQIQWTPKTWMGWKYYKPLEHLKNKNIIDPLVNARVALIIYQEYGWTPWVCKP